MRSLLVIAVIGLAVVAIDFVVVSLGLLGSLTGWWRW